MYSYTEEMKESDEKRKHNLFCKSPSVIVIYDAWDYLDDCKYYFKDNYCNGLSSCTYIRSRRWRFCDRWFRAKTKSKIRYYCVHNPGNDGTTTPKTLPSSEATNVITSTSFTKIRSSTSTNQNYSTTSNGQMNTTTPVKSTVSPLTAHSSKSNDAVIAGSVIGVLGVLSLILLLICCVLKRRKADKHKATGPSSVTNAVGQNSNVLYVVPENGLPHDDDRIDDQPPAYHTLDNIPGQNHIYINDDYGIGQNLKHQHANNYNHIHGTVVSNPSQNDDYNHTDTDTVNISGGIGDNYNHIPVSGRNSDVHTEIEDGYNHIRSTEGVHNHDIGDYNHIAGQTGGEENAGYMEDDYNHLENSNNQNTLSEEQPCEKEDRTMERSQNKSQPENDYANIGVKEGNNGADDFEPDDTYVYS